MTPEAQQLAEMLDEARRVVVFTGAGISTESGIPDYRSAGGLWTKVKPIQFQDFVSSEEIRRDSWRRRFSGESTMATAAPNKGHLAIAHYVGQGKVSTIITQNVDGLHQRSGVPDDQVIELHGNASYCTCLDCARRFEMEEVERIFLDRETVPYCDCGGIIKTATVSFGQSMPLQAMQRAEAEALACDMLLAIGSSLVVFPAAAFLQVAKENGARLAILNREPTDFDAIADLVVNQEIGPTMEEIQRLHHNQ